jgi:hypothetical protein
MALREDLAGDADCNGAVDAGDADSILSFVAGIEPSDCVIVAGNVLCADALDLKDALAVLRYAVGAHVDLPPICPRPGHSIVAPPEVSLTCDADAAVPGGEIHCSYNASAYYDSPEVSWDFADAASVVAEYLASSVACPPDHVPCIWARSDAQVITFDSLGPRNITVTGCVETACAEATWQVVIESQQ